MRRRALLAASAAQGDGNIFPMHLNLEKVNDEEYRLDPTPESIALCDYFISNASFDGQTMWSIFLNPGELYIDGIEVMNIYSPDGLYGNKTYWEPYSEVYDDFMTPVFEMYKQNSSHPKGTLRVFDDD